ncbi:hypothetical protein QA542_02015 [Staphylococcus saprophyticus]|nr:hypothetical protein QA542_02015 [Staphylococcus saprophyticus]
MINLFDVFDKKAIILYKSFKHVGKQRKTIVIEENGFLPDDILTPYAFSRIILKQLHNLYFLMKYRFQDFGR